MSYNFVQTHDQDTVLDNYNISEWFLKIIFTSLEIFSTKYFDAEWVDIQRIRTNQATYLYQFLQWVQTKKFWLID